MKTKHKINQPYQRKLKSDRHGLYVEKPGRMLPDGKFGPITRNYITNFKIRLISVKIGQLGEAAERVVEICTRGGRRRLPISTNALACPLNFRIWLLDRFADAQFSGGQQELMMLIEDLHAVHFYKNQK